jgi:hypothetical protein
MKKGIKKGPYAKARAEFAQYGLPLRMVMCGKVVNGRFYLTNRSK